MRMICVYNPWRYGSNYIISSTWDQNEKVLGGSHFVLQTIGATAPACFEVYVYVFCSLHVSIICIHDTYMAM